MDYTGLTKDEIIQYLSLEVKMLKEIIRRTITESVPLETVKELVKGPAQEHNSKRICAVQEPVQESVQEPVRESVQEPVRESVPLEPNTNGAVGLAHEVCDIAIK